MKNVFSYLKLYSPMPVEVDKLIVSAFVDINGLKIDNNRLLKKYIISKDRSPKSKNLVEFITAIKNEVEIFDIEKLIELFEFVISPSDRIVNGAVYTPAKIRNYIIHQSFRKNNAILNTVKVADISCGCSGFLFTAARELKRKTGNSYFNIYRNQIFGLDIQKYSITRSKLLLSLLALSEDEDVEEFHFNFHQADALTFRWNEHYQNFDGFDIIVGNPPYVCARNLGESIRKNLRSWSVSNSGNPDLYIPFFQIGYENLSNNGILGFITMNTFFKSLNGRELRKYFQNNQVKLKIIDFGTLQIFKKKSTYTCICFLERSGQNYIEYHKPIKIELPTNKSQFKKIDYKNLDYRKGWNLNNNDIISKIESTGIPFGKKYKTRHGIATLKNHVYIFKPVAEDGDFYYLQNGSLYPIEKGLCKDILNSNKLSRNVDLDVVKEKVLFPYDTRNKPRALDEDVLRKRFPRAFEYLKDKKKVLASRDRGSGKYEKWFAFGRTQSLEKVQNKLFIPKFSDQIPNYLINNDDNLLFYNGQAIVGHSEEEMLLIKKILESRLFWYYIKTTSKPYSSEYYSFDSIYIKNFGIPNFNNDEIRFLLQETDKDSINKFLEDYYQINLEHMTM